MEVSTVRLLPPSSANKVSDACKDNTSEREVSLLSGRCEHGTVGRLSEFGGLMPFVKGGPTFGRHDDTLDINVDEKLSTRKCFLKEPKGKEGKQEALGGDDCGNGFWKKIVWLCTEVV
jgi:hypothetical protein